jgi:hypothetical protein
MRELRTGPSMTVPDDRPLIGVPAQEDGRDVVRYYTDEGDADAAQTESDTQQALAAIGSWSDLDAEEALEALDRLRHESEPDP